MSCRTRLLSIILVAGLAPSLTAGPPLDDLSVLRSTAGSWEGTLAHRDYTSDETVRIPLKVDARVSPDGGFLVRDLTLTDPGREVRSFEVLSIDPESGRLVLHSFGDRRSERAEYDIVE